MVTVKRRGYLVPENIHAPSPHRRVSGNPNREGVAKAKVLKQKNGAKLEFPEGWGVQTKKTFHGGCTDIFWNHTHMMIIIVSNILPRGLHGHIKVRF